MKTRLKRVLALLITASLFISFAISAQATQSVAGNFYKTYTLTGNGASDIVAVAQAQLGRSQSHMGYTEAWCADFVSDCARLAGVESLIPFNGGVSYLRNAMLNAGGSVVSSRQKGDIVFYYCSNCSAWTHVGIVQDGTYSIEGNVNGQVYKVGGTNGNYMDASGHTLGSGITREYIRPQYVTHTCSYSSSVTKAATCNATGVRTYSCSCGKSYTEAIAKNASNHAGGTVIKNAVAATHTSTGYTGDTYCGGCNKLLKTGTTTPKIDETQWVYVSELPSHVTADKYDIEYNNIHKKVATSSPGSDWVKGSLAKTEYVNNGSTYESDFALSTSKTRVLVSYYYYHWCGSSTGNMVNYAYTDAYNHLDIYPEPNAVIEEQSVADSDDARYTAYKLAWAHDPSAHCYCAPALTCDSSNSHTTRSCWWYKKYVYQNKKAVNYYNYSKESGWTENKDSSATTVECRYKLKPHECSYTATVTAAATCTKAGVKTYYCECGNSYTEAIPALNHKDTLVKVAARVPTCTEIGWDAYEYCTACTYTTYKEKAALKHDIVIDSAVAPTCTETGLTEGQHCSRCDDMTILQEIVPVKPHNYTIKYDSVKSWKECVCGAKTEEKNHKYGADNICDSCGFKKEITLTMVIRKPSATTISYGDSIILHADVNEALPSGWKIKWTADSGNFSFSSSADGSTCTITPNKSGDTTFTVTVYDEKGNVVSEDTQTMTSKAGFFDKLIAFFKKLFGLTKVIQQSIDTIY